MNDRPRPGPLNPGPSDSGPLNPGPSYPGPSYPGRSNPGRSNPGGGYIANDSQSRYTPSMARTSPPPSAPRLDSASLLRGQVEVEIIHGEDVYRLRHTRAGKLILTK